MTRPDDAESVKLLREALAALLEACPAPHHIHPAHNARAKAHQALAATAPRPQYRMSGALACSIERDGTIVVQFFNTDPHERAAVLDALNALAEKEASR